MSELYNFIERIKSDANFLDRLIFKFSWAIFWLIIGFALGHFL